MNHCGILDDVMAAHGGRERWRALEAVECSLSCGGLAFASHCQGRALRDLRPIVRPHDREVVFRDFCRPGWRGRWSPMQVQIRDDGNRLIGERQDPRASFGRLVKQFCWDKLDILYFGGYALWNYLSFPFILEEPGVSDVSGERVAAGGWRLTATFEAGFPTHSARQVFHLDDSLRLVRHDYTADVIGGWATAANLCLAAAETEGLRFYTRRKVLPRFGGGERVMPWPVLVWIEIDDVALGVVG